MGNTRAPAFWEEDDGAGRESRVQPRWTMGETPVVQALDRSPEPPVHEPDGARPPEAQLVPEIGGPQGPEPTRFGDWERRGRCIDF
jgi:hypothetical protein